MRRRLVLSGALLCAMCLAQTDDALQWPLVKQQVRSEHPRVLQLAVPELAAWLRDTGRARPLLIDAREADEYADGHLPGALRADTVKDALRLLQQTPAGTPAVLYCSVGARSSALAEALTVRSQRPVYNLEGSIFEWANAGHRVVNAQGQPAKVHPFSRRWGTLLRRDLWSRDP